jgi:hypothetical protein
VESGPILNVVSMSYLTDIGTALNALAAITMLVPLLFSRQEGHLNFRNRDVATDEAATKLDGNEALRQALVFSRDCAFLAFALLVSGTLLLLI